MGIDPTKLVMKKNGKHLNLKANALMQKAGNRVSAMNMATKIFGKEMNPDLAPPKIETKSPSKIVEEELKT